MLRRLTFTETDQAAVVHRASFDNAYPHLVGLHAPDDDRRFYREHVFPACRIWGDWAGGDLLGIIAFRRGWIDQLYVLPAAQGRGVGTGLLHIAQGRFGRLSLWTFQCNDRARSFYEKHGFVLVKETDGLANEEKEPDALYTWTDQG